MVGVGIDASMPAGPALRLVQVPGIGVDALDLSPLPDGTALCTVERHEGAVAEFVILQLLEWRHRAREAQALHRGGDWRRSSCRHAPARRVGRVADRHHWLRGDRTGADPAQPALSRSRSRLPVFSCRRFCRRAWHGGQFATSMRSLPR
jgi:hypothetical protein